MPMVIIVYEINHNQLFVSADVDETMFANPGKPRLASKTQRAQDRHSAPLGLSDLRDIAALRRLRENGRSLVSLKVV